MTAQVSRQASRLPKRPGGAVLVLPAMLVVWTVVVWGTRIRNILTDEALVGSDRVVRLVLAVGLVGLGLVAGVALWSNRPQVRWAVSAASEERLLVPPVLRRAVAALAVVGGLTWLVRGVQIALADHAIGFIVVHSLLAVGTIALSGAAVWSLRPQTRRR